MSVQTLAQQLQAEGRNGDSLLVHMTPREVGGLQALAKAHGGSLTVNPKTGLVEANFLESILPTILGIGLSFTPIGPLAAAGLVGGGTALATGNLEKGLLAGLGAYGGAGLGGAIQGAGTTAAMGANAAQAAGTETAKQAATLIPPSGMSSAAGIGGTTSYMPSAGQAFSAGLGEVAKAPGAFLSSNLGNIGMAAAPMLGSFGQQQQSQDIPDEGDIRQYSYTQEVNPNFGMPGQPYFNQYYTPGPVTPASQFTGFADGGEVQGPYTRPTRTVDPAVTEYNAKLMQRAQAEYNQSPQLAAFRSALPNQGVYDPQAGEAFQALQQQRQQQAQDAQANQFGYKYDPLSNSVVKAQPSVDQYAELQKQMDELRRQQSSLESNTGGFSTNFDSAANGGIMRLNKGGYTLGGYSDGGRLLKGPGDGVSDDIPATIEGRQPARLADGEFVVPARIVSEIGNGSTDAGARRLYAMMDRVQQNRSKTTGKDRIAVDTGSHKELPA